jgi:hypothetical protein
MSAWRLLVILGRQKLIKRRPNVFLDDVNDWAAVRRR